MGSESKGKVLLGLIISITQGAASFNVALFSATFPLKFRLKNLTEAILAIMPLSEVRAFAFPFRRVFPRLRPYFRGWQAEFF